MELEIGISYVVPAAGYNHVFMTQAGARRPGLLRVRDYGAGRSEPWSR